jgi:two-component system chemotaxis response regulator CheB
MWYMKGGSHKIIVIGTSAGGMQALERLLARLPADLPAALFIVQHLSVDSSARFLADRLDRQTELVCKVAAHKDSIEPGIVYMAPADMHLLLKEKEILVVRGPRENQFRPSIDPLFRSAAAYYGPHAIGVILTGFMSDGVAGMEFIKRSGGTTVVQDPQDAEFAPLPQNVIRQVDTDYIVPLDGMGQLLVDLSRLPNQNSVKVPGDIWQEAQIAERIMTNSAMNDIEELNKVGERVPYSCPECGGGLWELTQPGTLKRYRCHTGHAFTQDSLLMSMSSHLEETLWVALRTLEERRNIMLHMSQNEKDKGNQRWAGMQEDRAAEMKVHIERLRELLAKMALTDEQHIDKAS